MLMLFPEVDAQEALYTDKTYRRPGITVQKVTQNSSITMATTSLKALDTYVRLFTLPSHTTTNLYKVSP